MPPAGDAWETRAPEEAGFDPAKLQAAVDFAVAHETKFPPELEGKADARDLELYVLLNFAKEPYDAAIGPFKHRAPANGIILRHGYIVAEWGDTREADMTFSVTKTFITAVAGLAFDRGMIPDVNARVSKLVPIPEFASRHNRVITWDQMLRQTSGWEGTLWGKPWWADRPGKKGDPAWADLAAGPPEPGKAWEYNDVRVNALALALTHVWKRELPDVLREFVMRPIGASDTWHWEAYGNAIAEVDGKHLRVVPGGGHWGGGMFISARDMARIGLLGLRNGEWGDQRILSERWIQMARTPTPVKDDYGYMNWYLNTGRKMFPAARADSVAYLGNGTNMVFIDYEHDVVAVVRWIENDQTDEFVGRLENAINR